MTNPSTTVNFQELKDLYSTDPKAKALIDHYAERQRGRQDSTPPRMRRVLRAKGIDMSVKELSEFMRRMQDIGVGRCVSGRRGRVSRFVWGYHLKSVAEVAKGATTVLLAPPRDRVKLPTLRAYRNAPKAKPAPVAVAVPPPAPIAAISTKEEDKIIVRKAGLVIELPRHMSSDDWKDAALFLNNINEAG